MGCIGYIPFWDTTSFSILKAAYYRVGLGVRSLWPEFPYYITYYTILYSIILFVITQHKQHCCSTVTTRAIVLAAA